MPSKVNRPPSEAEVRKLRDAVYGPCTDANWENVKNHWMEPSNVAWLREQRQNRQAK